MPSGGLLQLRRPLWPAPCMWQSHVRPPLPRDGLSSLCPSLRLCQPPDRLRALRPTLRQAQAARLSPSLSPTLPPRALRAVRGGRDHRLPLRSSQRPPAVPHALGPRRPRSQRESGRRRRHGSALLREAVPPTAPTLPAPLLGGLPSRHLPRGALGLQRGSHRQVRCALVASRRERCALGSDKGLWCG